MFDNLSCTDTFRHGTTCMGRIFYSMEPRPDINVCSEHNHCLIIKAFARKIMIQVLIIIRFSRMTQTLLHFLRHPTITANLIPMAGQIRQVGWIIWVHFTNYAISAIFIILAGLLLASIPTYQQDYNFLSNLPHLNLFLYVCIITLKFVIENSILFRIIRFSEHW